MKNYLSELNIQQKEAVEYAGGPALVIAGAGSGKTRVLTTRIAYLLDQGVDAFSVLALTFTNKAAKEMRARIEKMFGTEARNIWMGTFHSMFARILRIEAAKIGYPVNFTIYDADDSKSLIRSIVKEEGLDVKLYKPAMVHNRISLAKNSFITAKIYQEDEEIISEDIAARRPKLSIIYSKYVKRCFKSGAMDFDDLLVKTYELFERFPDVLNKYQHKFKYVLIDEFQDTNLVQYLILKKIAASHRNLYVVGDDAQSIYSFRGANIQNILNFEKDYPELEVFKLEQNYRSTKKIVNASDNIIAKNKHQIQKKLWTENTDGSNIKIFKASSDSDEGYLVAQSIVEEKQKLNLTNKDFAILYRTNAQSRSFEESFRRFGLEYQIIGGISFYQRKEIKDILAYYRFTLNPNDEESLKRIINYPPRGIGATTIAKLIIWADENNCSIWDIVSNIFKYPLSSRSANAINDFASLIKSFIIFENKNEAFESAHHIAKSTGLQKLLYEDKTFEGINRYDNLRNLLSAIKEFTQRNDIKDKSLGAFLQEVSLLTDADNKDNNIDRISLMTVHSAKGLEFPCIYIVGMEENLFPSHLSLNSREELEEERRLFYVAITRAEKKAFISFAESRYMWGNVVYPEPSRFLEEIDTQYLDYDMLLPQIEIEEKPLTPSRKQMINNIRKKQIADYKVSPDFISQDISDLQVGMEVEHDRFGTGKVLQLSGNTNNMKAIIYFHNLGQKQILLRYAKMRIIEK